MDFAQLCTAETFLLDCEETPQPKSRKHIYNPRPAAAKSENEKKKKKCLHAVKEQDKQMAEVRRVEQ